jgi:hypothetical protein
VCSFFQQTNPKRRERKQKHETKTYLVKSENYLMGASSQQTISPPPLYAALTQKKSMPSRTVTLAWQQ